ncbi:MAG: BrnT family toxin [Candidatus Levybacteria bacterium]|nr:BrnT family toxin [Candidatus Levybacteria bacterium]
MVIDRKIFEFEWDKGNIEKNKKHKIKDKEAEEVFFDENKVIYKDILHSKVEKRFILLGKNKKKRLLYVVFTKRGRKIRIISARGVNKKEVHLYEKKT